MASCGGVIRDDQGRWVMATGGGSPNQLGHVSQLRLSCGVFVKGSGVHGTWECTDLLSEIDNLEVTRRG
ncbi:hypothetical protein V6N13_132077 [Hibiscus sabdariffa]